MLQILILFFLKISVVFQAQAATPTSCRALFERTDDVQFFEGRFLAPNEIFPHHARPLLARAPKGSIVGVGSERLLFNFLLKDTPTPYILAVDRDHGILRFHKINSILLSMTAFGDTAAYRRLRLDRDFKHWRKVATQAREQGWISKEDFSLIVRRETMVWWLTNVTFNYDFGFMHTKDESVRSFEGVNYLYDSQLLIKLQSLARNRRYLSMWSNLAEPWSLDILLARLQQLKIKMSVFDISNAWEHRTPNLYLGPARVGTLLHLLQNEFSPGGFLVVTAPIIETKKSDDYGQEWAYTGFPMLPKQTKSLQFWQKQAAYMDSYQRQRQIEIGRQILAGADTSGGPAIEWSELAELIYW